jgi:hypothetical protein
MLKIIASVQKGETESPNLMVVQNFCFLYKRRCGRIVADCGGLGDTQPAR